ncbi:MAG: glycoside hydrolase family 43 protein [Pseudomonadota bacterium]
MIKNPIIPGFNPDPSIVRVGDDYYCATSTFEWYPGVQIHHSRDLVNWRLVSRPLNRPSLLDLRGVPDSCGVWAPCLSWNEGHFWLIYTVVRRFDGNFKDTHNYLTRSASIDGQWEEAIYLNSSGFDPSLFHDDDGRRWLVNMTWDGRHNRNRFGGVLLQEYDHETRSLTGEIRNIFPGTALGCTEAPHLYRREGWYYLVTAEGGTGYGHAMTLARSRSLTGPFEVDPQGYLLSARNHPELPLQRTGHGDFVDTQDGDHYLVHLCSRPLAGTRRSPLGRETALQEVQWSEDDWLRLKTAASGDGLATLELTAPKLPLQTWPEEPTRHDFDQGQLPEPFQWLRTPEPSRILDLESRPGFLRLHGRESLGSQFEQALVARRQEHFTFEAETCLEFSPDNTQQCAGLVCYYNAHKYHYCFLSIDDQGKRFVDLMSCEADESLAAVYPLHESREPPGQTDPARFLPDRGAVWLRCRVDGASLCFDWSLDGIHWNMLPALLDHSLLSDEAGKGEGANFTGAFVGLCCQDLSGQAIAADFDFFDYRPQGA